MDHFNTKGCSPTSARKKTKVITGRSVVPRPFSKKCRNFFLFVLVSLLPSLAFPQVATTTDKTDHVQGETVTMVNPFASGTLLEFTSKTDALAVVEVYDVQGAKVASLFRDHVKAYDTHVVSFQGDGLPDGIYIYVLAIGNRNYCRKLVLSR